MKIELENPLEGMEEKYREEISKFIARGIISLEEWNKEFKFYRDDFGYSIIHYLISASNNLDIFVTNNPLMLKNKKKLEKRFRVKIITLEELRL